MVDGEALADSLFVVVGASALLSAQDEAVHQFVFGHFEVQHDAYFLTPLGQHLLQRFGLGDGAGKSVEDDALRVLQPVERGGQDVYDEVVRQQLTLVNVALGRLAQFGAGFDFGTQHVARRNVVDTILGYDSLTLCALA